MLLIRSPASPVDTNFSLFSGSRPVAINNIVSTVNSLGNSEIVLELAQPLPVNTVVKLSYRGVLTTDQLGNKLKQFSNRIVTSLSSSQAIASPGYSYANLFLTGDNSINASGNEYNNALVGNSADNVLEGGLGVDVLTGGLGRDTFKYSSFTDSRLLDPITGKVAFDRITDLTIGSDAIDGPYAVSSDGFLRVSSTASGTVDTALIQSLLPSSIFTPYKAAIISLTDRNKTFLVINNGTRGFLPSSDLFIEITGYTGSMDNLSII